MSDPQEKVVRTEAEWRAMLTPEQYRVLREKDTERPFTGALTENRETGNYHCAGCGALLFLSGAKFDSGCGWPSFMLPAGSKAVAAPAAAATSATSSPTARAPPACATASTPPR